LRREYRRILPTIQRCILPPLSGPRWWR
jgi:hypothetical protein